MSSEWRTYSLDEVGRIVTGKTPKSGVPAYEGSDVPFVSPSDFTGNKWIIKATRSISEAGALSVKGSMVPARSVLVTCIGSDMGRAAMAASRCVTNQQINSVLVDEERFCPEFLYYNLSLRKAEIRGLAGGSAQPILNKSAFGRISFEAPPLDEQRQISAALRPIDDRIALLRETNATLEAIAQALFKSWFIDFDPVRAKAEGRQPQGMDAATAALFPDSFEESELGPIPKGWHVGCVEDICSIITNGGTPSRSNPKFWEDGIIPWFKTGEFHDSFLLRPSEFITEAALQGSSVKLLPRDAVLMAIYAAPTVGRLGILTEPATFNQACTGMVAKDKVGTWFLFWTLYYGRDWFNSRANGAAQQNISKAIVSAYRVVIPSPPVLGAFNDTLAAIHEVIRANSEKTMTLSVLRDTLLPRLISGQVRLNEAHELVEEVVT